VWSVGLIAAESTKRADKPDEQLLAIFAVLAEWFELDDFEACSFVKVLVEMGPEHPLGRASIVPGPIRNHLGGLAQSAELTDPDGFARSMIIILKGTILSAPEGDDDTAARSVRPMAALTAGWRCSGERASAKPIRPGPLR
jgi:hypothetical protein